MTSAENNQLIADVARDIVFTWITLTLVVNGGALLALPITLIVSVIVHQTRESHREGVTL